MTRITTEVSVGKPVKGPNGPIYVAPLDTTLPTDGTTALANTYIGLGYVSEAGWSETVGRDTSEIKDWEGTILLKPQTGYTITVTFGLLQTNKTVMGLVFGAENVTDGDSSGEFAVVKTAAELPHQVFVIETLLSDGRIKRSVLNNAQITDVGEIQHTAGDAIAYQLTVTAYPDSDGKFGTDYYAKPAVVTP